MFLFPIKSNIGNLGKFPSNHYMAIRYIQMHEEASALWAFFILGYDAKERKVRAWDIDLAQSRVWVGSSAYFTNGTRQFLEEWKRMRRVATR
jgi:hypothetical protein